MDLDLICESIFLPQTVFTISMSFKPQWNKHTKENFQIQNFTGLKAWVVFRNCVLSGCYIMHVFKSTKSNIKIKPIKPKEPHGDCDGKCSTNTFGVVRLQSTAFKRWRHGRDYSKVPLEFLPSHIAWTCCQQNWLILLLLGYIDSYPDRFDIRFTSFARPMVSLDYSFPKN